MGEFDVKKLAAQLDAAQAILDEIRVTSGCDIFGPARQMTVKRVETALQTAERAYEERQTRGDYVGGTDIFGEPAWDILLDLFIRQTKDEQVSVKSACVGTAASAPTAMRWIKVLEQNGMIWTDLDPADSNRHLIHLTATGYEGMLRYLESIVH